MNDWTDETGATAVEYSLVATATAVGLIVLGPWLVDVFGVFLDAVLSGILAS